MSDDEKKPQNTCSLCYGSCKPDQDICDDCWEEEEELDDDDEDEEPQS
jgi:hypothetical protein